MSKTPGAWHPRSPGFARTPVRAVNREHVPLPGSREGLFYGRTRETSFSGQRRADPPFPNRTTVPAFYRRTVASRLSAGSIARPGRNIFFRAECAVPVCIARAGPRLPRKSEQGVRGDFSNKAKKRSYYQEMAAHPVTSPLAAVLGLAALATGKSRDKGVLAALLALSAMGVSGKGALAATYKE